MTDSLDSYPVYLEVEDLNDDDRAKLAEKLDRKKIDPDVCLSCEAAYEIDGPDPSVGIMTATVDVTSVSYNDPQGKFIDVTDFFDLDKIATQIDTQPLRFENPDDEYDRCRNEEQ